MELTRKEIEGKQYFFKGRKCLMSPTGSVKYFTRGKFLLIPKYILEKAKCYGVEIMEYFANKLSGEPVKTEPYESIFNNLIKLLNKLKTKPLYLEKFISNDKWYGYLDIECNDCFIEIKTRTKIELDLQTVYQCEVYKKICGKKYHIIFIDRKTGECKELKPTEQQIKKAQEIIKSIEFIYEELN